MNSERDGLVKDGNSKMCISIKTRNREVLLSKAGSIRKIGQLIDELVEDKYCKPHTEQNIDA